ncbi:hypothetical protein HMF7854_14915 [Sphingomonas ginkgonis]|uniref:Lipoprotein n=1 Tax=Sphingomonas ginkgonis TaxID=2315330 RepID=A0A3R9WS38_9SPHN|nr:hypothetical protein [Sphingomonas ginkgonis]RST31987.1 hypothetical protein HMF7854_14915 [Sphingomonas ginkgonis]
MKRLILLSVLLLPGCNNQDAVAQDAKAAPPLNVMSATPGDWSGLQLMAGREPAESGLMVNSPIVTDLNAMLGPSAGDYRKAMARAEPLRREGPLLVALSPASGAYLLIDDHQHAMKAGMRQNGRWRSWQTPASDFAPPPDVQALTAA